MPVCYLDWEEEKTIDEVERALDSMTQPEVSDAVELMRIYRKS